MIMKMKKTIKKKILVVFIFKLFFLGRVWLYGSPSALVLKKGQEKPNSLTDVRRIVSQISRQDLTNTIREFVQCCRPNRMVGTKGNKIARKYLYDQIVRLDGGVKSKGLSSLYSDTFRPQVDMAIEMYKRDFKKEIEGSYRPENPLYKKWKNFTDSVVRELGKRRGVKGVNIVWEKKGLLRPDEIIIVGAHYDNIGNKNNYQDIDPNMVVPGADDNGSGVAVALTLIEILSQLDLPKTVRVVFFDWEELGFLGSRAYVQKYKEELRKKKFNGYINLEMLGHDSKKYDKKKLYGNMKIYIRKPKDKGSSQDLQLAQKLQMAGKKMTSFVKFEIKANSFQSSDNVSFWEESFPALTFTEDWENDFNQSRYHTSNDFVETLNLKTLYHAYRYITGATIAWAFDL